MTDRYSEWRDFYAEKVRSWMSLEELRAECGMLQTTDATSPEVLLIHAMHALEECVQRDEALLRQALEALEEASDALHKGHPVRVHTQRAVAALRERLRETKEPDLWRCTVCGRVGTVGRCCGDETREPVSHAVLPEENSDD